MTGPHITIPEMLSDLDERIRVEEARLENSTDGAMTERHRAEIRMLRAIATQIAGPGSYMSEGDRP